ncbi:MAG: hypothetical protein HYT93_04465 [Parcubacteria group bacterium]|nr:hypothetical protein [Parcubacteria group bacterium]
MKFCIFLLLIAFIGISGVGFLAMGHASSSTHAECLAISVLGVTCPDNVETLSFINFHINAWKNFSYALIYKSFSILIFLAALLILVITIRIWNGRYHQLRTPTLYSLFVYFLKVFVLGPVSMFLYWLALREHSPTIF